MRKLLPWHEITDGAYCFWPNFFEPNQADEYLSALRQTLSWRQDQIKVFGKVHLIPRLQAWYGEYPYCYSNLILPAQAMPHALQQIADAVTQQTGVLFNSVLANWYRNGEHHMGWHSDNEPELGADPWIASLSLGAERTFKLKHKFSGQTIDLQLTHGSLLLMGPGLQSHWLHALPKRRRVQQPRINLTFRQVKPLSPDPA